MARQLRAIKRKIRTVTNIYQIARAMKMVAAARMQRLRSRAERSKAYTEQLWELARRVAAAAPEFRHPYVLDPEAGPPQRPLAVVVAGDKGLCGSYNSLVFHLAEQVIQRRGIKLLLTVGDRCRAWVARRGLEPLRHYELYPGRDQPDLHTRIARQVRSLYDTGVCDAVVVVHTPFASTLHNMPQVTDVLPLRALEGPVKGPRADYIFEPAPQVLLGSLLPRVVEGRLVQILIEAATAEQAARMTAMTAATDNAEELIQHLIRQRNRMRQQAITTEILEIVAAAEALQEQL